MNTLEITENEAERMGYTDGQTIPFELQTAHGKTIVDVVVKVISEAEFQKIVDSQKKVDAAKNTGRFISTDDGSQH